MGVKDTGDMDKELIQKWKDCEEWMGNLGITWEICPNGFMLHKGERSIALFNSVAEVFAYLCGWTDRGSL